MAKMGIELLKQWFSAGRYPTGAQFASMMDSFRHKDDKVTIEDVATLPEELNRKCNVDWGREVQGLLTQKDDRWWVADSGMFGADFLEFRVWMMFGVVRGSDSTTMDVETKEMRYDIQELKRQYLDNGVNCFIEEYTPSTGAGVVVRIDLSGAGDNVVVRVVVLDPGNESNLIKYKVELHESSIGIENPIPDEA